MTMCSCGSTTNGVHLTGCRWIEQFEKAQPMTMPDKLWVYRDGHFYFALAKDQRHNVRKESQHLYLRADKLPKCPTCAFIVEPDLEAEVGWCKLHEYNIENYEAHYCADHDCIDARIHHSDLEAGDERA